MVIFVLFPTRHIKIGTNVSFHERVHQKDIQERPCPFFLNQYPFSTRLYYLFKSSNHPQRCPQMSQLNSGFQTPLNYIFCPNPLIFQMWILKSSFSTLGFRLKRDHQLTPFCHSFPVGERKRDRGKLTFRQAEYLHLRENFPCVFKKEISALDALAPIPCSVLSQLISSPHLPMCLVGQPWIQFTVIHLATNTI